jgi:hypothetical protein
MIFWEVGIQILFSILPSDILLVPMAIGGWFKIVTEVTTNPNASEMIT